MNWDVAFEELAHGGIVSFDNSGADVELFAFLCFTTLAFLLCWQSGIWSRSIF